MCAVEGRQIADRTRPSFKSAPAGVRDSLASACHALSKQPARALLADPLEYLYEEHFRQRSLCFVLDAFATEGVLRTSEIRAVLGYFDGDFALHIMDEDHDLFPMLRSLASAEDAIDPLLDSLTADHVRAERVGKRIVAMLAAQLERGDGVRELDRAACREIVRFCATERRHLMLENAIVLPLARIRLDADHRRQLATRMRARHERRRPVSANPQKGGANAR